MKNIQTINANISNNFIDALMTKKNLLAFQLFIYLSKYNQNIERRQDTSIITIDIKHFNQFFNFDKQNIRKTFQELQTILIKSKTFDASLYPLIDYKYNGIIKITMFNIITDQVFNLLKDFTIININNFINLNNINSFKFLLHLERINRYDFAKAKTYNLEELNAIFNTKYKTLKQIEANILKPILIDLNNYSNISFNLNKVFNHNKGKGRPFLESIKIEIIDNLYIQPTLF
jgi:hypothetical protein